MDILRTHERQMSQGELYAAIRRDVALNSA